MEKIFAGYYLKPHVWIGEKKSDLNPCELAILEEEFASQTGLGVQTQGLIIASFETDGIPGYQNRHASNTLGSETASYILTFFNAFSFAYYEANLSKHKGGFGSIPQDVVLNDLYLWPTKSNGSIQTANIDQPIPITTGEFSTMAEMVSKGLKTIGSFEKQDFDFRLEVDKQIFTTFFNKQIISGHLRKLFALMNRGVVSIRGASFDIALVSFWTVAESLIKDMWNDLLASKEVDIKRKEFLTGRDITAAIICENLNLHGIISEDLYDGLSMIRKARNKMMHELRAIDPKICYRAYEVIKQLIKIQHGVEISHGGSDFIGDIQFGNPRS